MADAIEGFYSCFFSARAGNGFAVFVFTAGKVVGADPEGALFDGQYENNPEGTGYKAKVKVTLPPGGGVNIQGIASGKHGFAYEVAFELPLDFAIQPFVRIDTPLGPVNVRFSGMYTVD